MNDRNKSYLIAALAAVGVYWFLDANDSVRNAIAVVTFFFLAHFVEGEIEKDKQKVINDKLLNRIKDLEDMVSQLKR